jgi:hypothetical protein
MPSVIRRGGSLIEGMFVFDLVPKVSRFLQRTNRVPNNNFSSAAVATVARSLEKQPFVHVLRGIAVVIIGHPLIDEVA